MISNKIKVNHNLKVLHKIIFTQRRNKLVPLQVILIILR